MDSKFLTYQIRSIVCNPLKDLVFIFLSENKIPNMNVIIGIRELRKMLPDVMYLWEFFRYTEKKTRQGKINKYSIGSYSDNKEFF